MEANMKANNNTISKRGPFLPKSFLDPNLQVDFDNYAVSFVKKPYSSAKNERERRSRDHGFIIIQRPNAMALLTK
jgi:hypothetical protein